MKYDPTTGERLPQPPKAWIKYLFGWIAGLATAGIIAIACSVSTPSGDTDDYIAFCLGVQTAGTDPLGWYEERSCSPEHEEPMAFCEADMEDIFYVTTSSYRNALRAEMQYKAMVGRVNTDWLPDERRIIPQQYPR